MYIAFRWLVFLAFSMWLAMCVVDLLVKKSMKIDNAVVEVELFENYKNKSIKNELQTVTIEETMHHQHHHSYYDKEKNWAGIHFIMLLAGALAVTAYHVKQEIIFLAHRNIRVSDVPNFLIRILAKLSDFKNAATKSSVTILQYQLYLWVKFKIVCFKLYNKIVNFKNSHKVKHSKIHTLLLKKLKEMAEERKNLGQLLITAIHENKNIRMRYELENMTKNRLMQHIEDTHKQIKENRSRYVSFQHLYLVTHQENAYLKACLGKLRQEKDETEKNLTGLINEVYRSKNSNLIAYCTKFIVKTKDNILNSDVNIEIKEFLEKSRKRSETTLGAEQSTPNPMPPKNWLSCTSLRVTDVINEDDSLVPIVGDPPKLRGLPGEYVWTVKDKDGIIEKLYEYDFDADLDNGDTIRRIRQYSVYYDKDCLLDFSKVGCEAIAGPPNCSSCRSVRLDYSTSKQNLVTGSEAFQKFLQSNITIVNTKPPAPPLLCG